MTTSAQLIIAYRDPVTSEWTAYQTAYSDEDAEMALVDLRKRHGLLGERMGDLEFKRRRNQEKAT